MKKKPQYIKEYYLSSIALLVSIIALVVSVAFLTYAVLKPEAKLLCSSETNPECEVYVPLDRVK